MRVRVLGAVEAFADGAALGVPAGKPRAVLAMLALAAGRPVPPDTLVVGIWGEDAPASAVKTLQVHVSTLRSRLREADVHVELSSAGYALAVAPEEIDVVCFERLAEEGLAALAEQRPDVASRALQRALDLWTGPPLSNVLEAPFAAHEAERLAFRRLAVAEARIDADLALGLGVALVDDARALTEANPYDERACGQLMLALYRAGQPVAALEACRRLRRTLAEELGLAPGPGLVQLERQILTHDDALLVRPPAATIKRPSLPRQVSSFIGRERELTDVRTAVRTARLVTVTGAGGAGKTRLALAVGESMADEFPDGVWLVELAPLAAADNVVTATAQALGTRHDGGVDGVAEGIGDRAMLVVLDNCEHVVDAAAKLAEGVLRQCPHLRILATSREALAIGGEHVYRVPSLGLPPEDVAGAEAAVGSDAVRLFVDRARLHRRDFQLDDRNVSSIVQICARLDGMPLAIELAAARLRTFSVETLVHRLDERFRLLASPHPRGLARQQTLRTLIDWSYDLLNPAEQVMLERLAVFAGGFTMEAVEAIGSTEPDIDVLDVVTALVDKSLVEVDFDASGRLRLLETIREYAAERLQSRDPSIVDATRLAHARYYLAMSEEAAPALDHGPEQPSWLDRLTVEHDNMRAAAATFVSAPAVDEGLRLVSSLRFFWDIRGFLDEGAKTIADLLEAGADHRKTDSYLIALVAATDMFERLGHGDRAERLADEAIRLAPMIGRPDLEVAAVCSRAQLMARRTQFQAAFDALAPYTSSAGIDGTEGTKFHMVMGFVLIGLNDVAGSGAALAAAEQAARASGDERRLSIILSDRSVVDVAQNDLDTATAHLQEAQTLAARLGDVSMLGYVSLNLGLVALMQGRHERAVMRYREALLLSWPDGELTILQTVVFGLALCCSAGGQQGVAATLHGFLDAEQDARTLVLDPNEARLREEDRAGLRHALGEDEFERFNQAGRALTLADAVALAKDAATQYPHVMHARPDETA